MMKIEIINTSLSEDHPNKRITTSVAELGFVPRVGDTVDMGFRRTGAVYRQPVVDSVLISIPNKTVTVCVSGRDGWDN